MWVKQSLYKAAGACLAEARRKAGVSQDELAARLRKPQSFISSYERGDRRVDVLELVLIAEAIGVEPGRLFGEVVMSARFPARKRGL